MRTLLTGKKQFLLAALAVGVACLAFFSSGLFGSGSFSGRFISFEKADAVFPGALAIQAPGTYLQIPHDELLDPAAGYDFLLVSWFSLRRFPEDNERFILISKYDADSTSMQGYSLAVESSRDSLRPLIYWRDENGRGGWQQFSDFNAREGAWVMLALSFRENRYLGLHAVVLDGDSMMNASPKVILLGGYDMEDQGLPFNSSDLLYGASRTRFPGNLGPISIFAGRNFSSILIPAIKELARQPLAMPSVLAASKSRLWILDGENDLSPARHEVRLVRSDRQRRRRS